MGIRFGFLSNTGVLKIDNEGTKSFFEQSQFDGTVPTFAIAGPGEDLSAEKT
jgi:hypothetical protein